jgi:hypothetical protein
MMEAQASAGTTLARYDTMCRAIAEAYAVDEVKDIRDKAVAFEAYARQAKNTEAERSACEIRLRAERRVGQLLAEMDKAKGAAEPGTNRGATRSHADTASPRTLSDMGISKTQSARWQQLAAVPETQFEAALASPDKPTTTGIISPPKQEPMDPRALWLWGRLRDFERDGLLSADHNEIINAMTDGMRADVRRLAPMVTEWLEGI